MTEELKRTCNKDTKLFNAIINALQLPRGVDHTAAKRLLSFVDNIIDYYLDLDPQQGVRYPIVYIPCTKEWAEEICIEYVSYKIESIFDSNRMLQLQRDFCNLDIGKMGYSNSKARNVMRWWRKMAKPIVGLVANNTLNTRNLLVCGQSAYNRVANKQVYNLFLGKNPRMSVTCSDVIDYETNYQDFSTIQNIFCFYSNNGICDGYEPNSLNNWTNLRNCFIFEFNSAPYCLDTILRCGKRLCEKFPHRHLLSIDEAQNRYHDFITITQEEAHYIFNENPQNSHSVIPYPTEIEDQKEYILDFYKGDDYWKFSIKDRNILSICLFQGTMDLYRSYLKKEKPSIFENDWWTTILDTIITYFPTNEIINRITSFVNHETGAALIICDAPNAIKDSLKDCFRNRGLHIKIYQYKDLKEKKVKENKIVVLRFCPHNLKSKNYPHKNPNSFDEYPLKEGQTILDIINELTILDYSRHKYEYDSLLCLVTNSRFRRDQLGGELLSPKRPTIPFITYYSESDEDANEISQNNISIVRFEFTDGGVNNLPDNEVLICKDNNGEQFIDSIRNLNELDQLNNIRAIQPVSELADKTMDIFFEDERNTTTEIENRWRDELVKQGRIPQNHYRAVPIWKFLLERKIRNYCENEQLIDMNSKEPLWQLLRQNIAVQQLQNLYSQLGVKVQFERVLRDWCDVSKVEPIIPGFKRDRENLLINYLKLNRGQLSLYRKKQLLTRDITRTRNRVTEGFLSKILFENITDELVAELLEDSQYSEYLAIDNKEDIETLKKIAQENINLKTINSVHYELNRR